MGRRFGAARKREINAARNRLSAALTG